MSTAGERVSVNPMAMLDWPFEEEYPALAAAGARRVGLAARKLAERGWDDGVRGALGAGLEVAYVVHGVFTPPHDLAGWTAERGLLMRAVDAAAELRADLVYFCSGPSGPLRYEEAAEALGERLSAVVAHAQAAGVRLAVENSLSSRTDCSFVFTLRDAVALARALGVSVCADLYACWLEPELAETLHHGIDTLALVQVSDRRLASLAQPDRRVPGDGDLPLERLLADVVSAGYDGLFDLELLGPAIEAEGPSRAVARGLAWLRGAIDRLGAAGAPPPEASSGR